MNIKELTKKMDRSVCYKWVKPTPYSWRLVHPVTLKTAYGCEDRLTAVALTRKLRAAKFTVENPEA